MAAISECRSIIDTEQEEEELKKIAEEELVELEDALLEKSEEIVEAILPVNDADHRDCTLEIMQAAGGSESSLFAHDLVKMY